MITEKQVKQISKAFKILVGAVFVLSIFLSLTSPQAASSTVLTTQNNYFLINGQPKFLVLSGYWDGLDAPNPQSDLNWLRSKGFDGIRIFVNLWDYCPGCSNTYPSGNNPVINLNGSINQSRLNKLISIIDTADSLGMIVDVTFARETIGGDGRCFAQDGNGVMCMPEFKQGVISVIGALRNKSNVFFDLQNEYDHPAIDISNTDITDLKNRIRATYGDNVILSVSGAGAGGQVGTAQFFGMDMVNAHFAGTAVGGLNVDISGSLTPNMPTYIGEPYNTSEVSGYSTQKLIGGATNAKRLGVAAWLFHSNASFGLNGVSLQSQFASNELGFIDGFLSAVGGTTWGTNTGFTRTITSISPISAQPGSVMTIKGTNLSSTIHIFASSTSTRSTYSGSINGTNTQVTWTIPSDLANDSYTLKVGPSLGDVSNFVLFTLTGSTAPPPTPTPTPTPAPTPGSPTIDPSPQIPEWVDCDVFPEDLDLLADWNFWCGITPQQPDPPDPGTDPSNPISLPAIGSRGLSAVYNPGSDTFFYIGADQSGVVGASVISDGLSLSGETFRIDQSGQSPKDPRVIYNKTDDIFLVGWNDARPSPGRASIYGRIFSSSGEPLTGDFPIMNDKNVSGGDSEYDVNNNVFVVAYGAGGLYLRTVDSVGNLSREVSMDVLPGSSFAGEVDVTVNSNLDEYWITYVTCFGSDDCRVTLKRVSASSLGQVGEDIELNDQRIGDDAFSKPKISYSEFYGAAAIVWLEQGRVNQGGGIYGTTVYDDLNSSGVSAVITPATDPYSEFFDNPVLNNNPWTGAFFLSVSDDRGGVEMVEFIPGSIIVLTTNQVIAPVSEPYSNPTHAVYSGGATVFVQGSANSFANRVNGISPQTGVTTTNYPPGTAPTPVDTTVLGKSITQIYVWALGLSALLAMLMMVFGGYMVMTAAGNAEQSSKGKDFIWSSIVGMGILFASFLILNTINPDLVNFDLSSINQLNSPAGSSNQP